MLQGESSSNEEYRFTINIPLAQTTLTLNNAFPVEILIDSGSSVKIINQDKLKKFESLMSLNLIRMVAKLLYRRCAVEIYSNCTDKRTFATCPVTDAATSCILGNSASELLCVSSVLKPTMYENFLP